MLISFDCEGWGPYKENTSLDIRNKNETNEELKKRLDNTPCNHITAIFGPNSSGKTMILKGISALRSIVLGRKTPGNYISKTNSFSKNKSIKFKICFTLENNLYEYRLTLIPKSNIIASEQGIVLNSQGIPFQFLNYSKDSVQSRTKNQVNPSQKDLDVYPRTRSLIFETAQGHDYNTYLIDDKSTQYILNVYNFFKNKIIFSIPEINQISFEKKEQMSAILRHFDTGIEKIILENGEYYTLHSGCDYKFNKYEESEGTLKLIEYASLLVKTEDDLVFLVDEMDRKLHPNVVEEILKLFISKNGEKQQLIFTTHLTSLIRPDLIDIDNMRIVDICDDGTSRIIALIDEDIGFLTESDYLVGKYSGIPKTGDY